jgi:hypothetical protein
MAFDHYCPYVGNTVGLSNYRYFYAYCACFTAAALQWEALAVAYLRARGRHYGLIAAMAWFALFICFGLCGNQPLVWVVLTKLENSRARSHRSRFG